MPDENELPGTEETPVAAAAPAEKPAKAPNGKPAPVEEPTAFQSGQSVLHANGETYTVRHVTSEGVALVGVANLVDPSSLTLA